MLVVKTSVQLGLISMGLHRLLQKRSYSYSTKSQQPRRTRKSIEDFPPSPKIPTKPNNHIAQQKLQMSIPTPVLQKAHSGEPAGANNELIVRQTIPPPLCKQADKKAWKWIITNFLFVKMLIFWFWFCQNAICIISWSHFTTYYKLYRIRENKADLQNYSETWLKSYYEHLTWE